MTVWNARRVKDRVLCGRQVPPGGPYACMGEIGRVDGGLILRPGLTLDAGAREPRTYRATTRVRFPGKRLNPVDEASGATYERRRDNYLAQPAASLPLTAPCSHDGHMNLVTEAALRVL